MANNELNLAWQLVQNTGHNIFLTGKAGTGKTTFLRTLRERTNKRNVVLASTGIAAVNAGGSTLHSFFQLPFGPYIPGTEFKSDNRAYKFSEKKRRLIRSLDLVIIDEISMVRADLLDSVDAVLRRFRDHSKPFGGVQLLMIGDLQQLAPVAKPEEWRTLQQYYDTQYFFSSRALKEAGFVTVELKTVYRQTDQHFIDLLGRVRNNSADAQVLAELNSRYIPNFNPPSEEGYIRLTTHNHQADQINDEELAALKTEPKVYRAEIWKEFPEQSYPTPEELTLKVGAQVMFVKNDSNAAKRYFNGMIGTVVQMADTFVKVRPQNGGAIIDVTNEQWENNHYELDEETKEIKEELIGTFSQLPLKTAWAITVHKSQGLTFEKAIIDVQYSFSHGQVYVALSRCKSLEGMVLSSMIPARAIINDQNVISFTNNIPNQIPSQDRVKEMQREYFLSLVAELFTFQSIRFAFDAYLRHIDEWLYKQAPDALQEWKKARLSFQENVDKVSASFAIQYQRLIMADYDYAKNETLQERCKKGAAYFVEHIRELKRMLQTIVFATNNKMVKERLEVLKAEFAEVLRQKVILLDIVAVKGFNLEEYQKQRALVAMGEEEKKKKAKGKSKTKAKKEKTAEEILYEIIEEQNSYANEDLPDFDYDGLPY